MIGKITFAALLVASAMFATTSAEKLSRAHVIVTKVSYLFMSSLIKNEFNLVILFLFFIDDQWTNNYFLI